jgi:hypothetical protein
MSDDDQPRVPVICSECDTETRVALSDLADTIERHNDQQHGGDDVAGVDPEVTDRITDLVAEDLGLLDEG